MIKNYRRGTKEKRCENCGYVRQDRWWNKRGFQCGLTSYGPSYTVSKFKVCDSWRPKESEVKDENINTNS